MKNFRKNMKILLEFKGITLQHLSNETGISVHKLTRSLDPYAANTLTGPEAVNICEALGVFDIEKENPIDSMLNKELKTKLEFV